MKRSAFPAALLLAAALLPAAAGCAPAPAARRAFFYWRTVFVLSEGERAVLQDRGVSRLYLRFFDVTWDAASGRALPAGRLVWRDAPPPGIEIVPVVFLRNEVFGHAPDPAELAGRVWKLAGSLAAGAGVVFRELQVDCDWTDGTRTAFFAFCRALKALGAASGTRLSVTVRLHQVKYRDRTGVPPADRALLMFYNVGRIEADPRRPSIFNPEDAARYTPFLEGYPLPLDAALAVFSWAVHGRAGRVVGLIEKVSVPDLDASPFLRRTAPGRYTAAEPAFFRGAYLMQGDTLALEASTPALAREAAELLSKHFRPRGAFTLALFDLDGKNLAAWTPEDLEAVFTAVRGGE
ncbi:MAG: hypothetical protein KA419_06860 [Acidobacteria bacterium]|nr:hypothetical protein [Acidobacteriota bacterium]